MHARRPLTSRNPTAFSAEQGLPATGISQYETLADAGGTQKAESDVFFDERSHSRHPRSTNNVPIGSQTDVLPAQVPKVNMTTGRAANVSHRRRKQDANFACTVPGCGSTFTRGFNLKGHLRSHFEEKPYKCHWPGCGKGFARQQDLKRHDLLHTNFRPLECEKCKKQFAMTDALNRHLRSGCVRFVEIGKGSGSGGVRDLDSGIDMSGITSMSSVVGWRLSEEQKQPSIPNRRQTGGGGGGGGDIWSGVTL